MRSHLARFALAAAPLLFTVGCAHAPAAPSPGPAPAATVTEPAAAPPVAAAPAAAEAAATTSAAARVAPAVELPNVHLGGGVATAGQPTLAQLAAAKAAGYRAVINLRTADEQGAESQADVEKLGLAYVAIPVAVPAGLSEANARALAAALAAPEHQPAVVHCASGNRAAGLLALKAYYVDHQSAAEALETGKRLGLTKLEPAVKAALDAAEAAKAK